MRNIPKITKNLLIINVLMFLATIVLGRVGVDLGQLLGLHFFLASDFHFYQLFTYMFMHGGFTHLFFNMFALFMFGCMVERLLGERRFIVYYLVCGLGAGVIQEISQFLSFYITMDGLSLWQCVEMGHYYGPMLNAWTTVGASGSIYGVLLAFGMLLPEERIFIFPLPIPIKGKWFVLIYAAIELFSALSTSSDGVAHFAHLGGMLFGWFLLRHWVKKSGHGGGFSLWQWLKSKAESLKRRRNGGFDDYEDITQESDWDYNRRQAEHRREIDRILDKVRRSGYDSLSDEEKRKLFDGK